MAKKSFKTVPKPASQLSQADIEAFEQGGAGQDKNPQSHKPTNVGIKEATKRLSIDLPESVHIRFKLACTATGRKMTTELFEFIEKRSIELEKKV